MRDWVRLRDVPLRADPEPSSTERHCSVGTNHDETWLLAGTDARIPGPTRRAIDVE